MILHLSDLHIGANDKTTRNAQLLVNAVLQKFADPKAPKPVVLITGDVVDDGEEEQYMLAGKLIDTLRAAGFTVACVPGNHDYGWNGCHAESKRFELFKKYLVGLRRVTYPDVIEVPEANALIIGLNSMKAECDFWDGLLADGELGSRQLSELAQIVASRTVQDQRKNQKLKVIVALHHHPFLYPDDSLFERAYEWAGHYLKDGDDLMRIIGDTQPVRPGRPLRSGAVDAVLFGHEHRHIDFSSRFKTENLPGRYGIPVILSCGSSTEGDPKRSGHASWLLTVKNGVLTATDPKLGRATKS